MQSSPEFRDTSLKAVPYEGVREKAIVRPEWKLEAVETGLRGRRGKYRTARARNAEMKFRAMRRAECAILIEVAITSQFPRSELAHRSARRSPRGPVSGEMRRDARRTLEGLRRIRRQGSAQGRILAAGGSSVIEKDARTVLVKIEAVGKHEANELLAIRSWRLIATLSTGPWASGDSFTNGRGPTDLASYGGAYIGLFAALVRRTEHERVLAFDLGATDFLSPARSPAWLCYNADAEARTVKLPGAKPVSIPAAGTVIVRAASVK